ncbi:LOW QUALITY PROTEIN: hypothetical protein HZS_294 [Henneguya salminicola]|nr:LOW QUALITY PROTEIN: hypothetical protein HZS_294 [Henneguya salminicola]
MGLGKTVQIVCYIGSLHFNKIGLEKSSFSCGLLVVPATLLRTWLREFFNWWPFVRVVILHHTGSLHTNKPNIRKIIDNNEGVVILTTYSTFLKCQKQIIEIDWNYVILDEGHKIKNPDAHINILAAKVDSYLIVKTVHRILVSGTPIQNNLQELWTLFNFVYPGLLGTLDIFMKEVAAHITKASYSNASDLQVQTGYKCAKKLKLVIEPYLLRRTKKQVQIEVMYVKLSKVQSELYKSLLNDPSIIEIIEGKRGQVISNV